MKTALFVMLPVMSHYNACFGLAATLREQGNRVVFTGTPDLRDHVEREGFEFIPMRYLEEYVIPNVRVAVGLFLKSSLDKTFVKSRYREFNGCVRSLEQLCRQTAPTTVYLDQHLNHYFFLLPTAYRNVVLLNTKLPTRRAKSIPPLTSSTAVRQNVVGMLYSQFLWWQLTTVRSAYNWLKQLVFLKADDTFFLQRQARKNGLSYAQWLRRDNALYDSLRSVPIVHLRPQEIEYDWYVPHDGEQFAYYLYQRNKVPTAAQTELWNGLTQLIEEQRQRGRLIVYSSLGTISAIEGQAANCFLSRLTEAVRQRPTVFLIISNRQWQQKSSELPENVACFDWVPQPELLYQCNLMITHGGMNSIGDCLKAGVPMLVYPLNLKSDQLGNAARVVAKGWGLLGNLQRDSPEQISRKIQQLITDKAMLQRVKSCRLASVTNQYPTMDLAESR